jgi:hypothetical protein
MAQYFRDAQGKLHEFPDDATPEEIDAATRQADFSNVRGQAVTVPAHDGRPLLY